MPTKLLTVVGLNVATALNKEIVQVFNSGFTKTFFMLKEDYIAEKDKPDSILRTGSFYTVPKLFDVSACVEFKRAQFKRYGTDKSKEPMRMLVVEYIERMYKGIQIVEKHEDVSPDFYTYELSTSDKDNKYQPEHFLIGTQVTVSPTIGKMYRDHLYPSVFTVQGIRANGPSSFVLVTTADDMSGILPGEKYSFNISHVENIVSQGKGIIKIQSRRNLDYGAVLQYERVERGYPQYAKKNHWLVYGGSMLITHLVHKLNIPIGSVVDSDSFVDVLLSQHFVKVINTGRFGPRLYLVNKKRARRFVKQNLNRFMSSAKKAQKEEDDEMQRYYCEEMERELDRDRDSRDSYLEAIEKKIHDDSTLDDRNVDYGDDYSPFDERLNRSSIFDADGSSFED